MDEVCHRLQAPEPTGAREESHVLCPSSKDKSWQIESNWPGDEFACVFSMLMLRVCFQHLTAKRGEGGPPLSPSPLRALRVVEDHRSRQVDARNQVSHLHPPQIQPLVLLRVRPDIECLNQMTKMAKECFVDLRPIRRLCCFVVLCLVAEFHAGQAVHTGFHQWRIHLAFEFIGGYNTAGRWDQVCWNIRNTEWVKLKSFGCKS